MPTASRRVLVISLGGTIAMTATAEGGVAPALSAEQLLAAVPVLADLDVAITTANFRQLPGASLTFDDLDALSVLIREQLGDAVDGVVVVQGTDTIEETAYVLDLCHAGPEPIIVTGAMRNPTQPGADGPANLTSAIAAAASPATREFGCLVALADEIHAARRVRKTHSTACSTFQSPNGGPLGYLVERQPRMLNRPLPRFVVAAPTVTRSPRVALVTIALGDDGVLLDGLGERTDGVVIAGFGVGHVPARLVDTLTNLTQRVPVVLASRTGAGSVLTATYGFPGSERDLVTRGLIPAGFLDPLKARILLRAVLAAGADRPTISAAFAAGGGYHDPGIWPWPSPEPTNREGVPGARA